MDSKWPWYVLELARVNKTWNIVDKTVTIVFVEWMRRDLFVFDDR
jgi:hypothetical protein